MSLNDATDYIIQELTRRLTEVATRLESGLSHLDQNYVRKDLYDLGVSRQHDAIEALKAKLEATDKEVEKRLTDLEDDKKWLTRLIMGFIVMGVLGAVFITAKAGGA